MKSKILIYLIAIISAVLLTNCAHQTEKAAETPKYVKIEQVSNNDEGEKLVFNGVVKEKSLNTISFRVGGPLHVLNVKPGDFVEAGDLIAAIDKRDYELQIRSTKAQYEQLESEYHRYKKLFELNKIPANSFEKVESGYLMAKTAYENALNQLKDTDLIAPVSGYIHEKFVENFQTVGPAQPIVSIIDKSHLEVVVSIPEKNIAKVKRSKNNFLTIENAGVEDLPVEVYSIAEKAADDGMFEVKFLIREAAKTSIFPGMTAEISLHCMMNGAHLSIPSSALFRLDSSTYVWVYNQKTKTIKKRKVNASRLLSDGRMEIVSGLKVSENIVVAGVNNLVEGQRVQPIPAVSTSNVGGLL